MAPNILVRPFNNISDPDEESVLAILAHLMPLIDAWRTGEDLRVELEALEASKPKLSEDVERIQAEIHELQSRIARVFINFNSSSV